MCQPGLRPRHLTCCGVAQITRPLWANCIGLDASVAPLHPPDNSEADAAEHHDPERSAVQPPRRSTTASGSRGCSANCVDG
jgi:hypothetical protein